MPITPQMAQSVPSVFAETAALNCQPSSPFLLMAHPGSAMVVTDGLKSPTWVPAINLFRLSPGVEHVATRRRGDSYPSTIQTARLEKQREGFVIIEPDLALVTDPKHLPAGVTPGAYIREYQTYDRRTGLEGKCYREVWDVQVPTRSLNDSPKWKFDKAAYNRWVVSLLEAGVIPGPDEYARNEFKLHAARWAAEQHNIDDPSKRADKVKATQASLKTLETATVVGAA